MTTRASSFLLLLSALAVTGGPALLACSSDDSTGDDLDAGPAHDGSTVVDTGTPVTDSGSALGFTPSNIATLVAAQDLSGLDDVSITSNINVSLACGVDPHCLAVTGVESDGATPITVYIARSWTVAPGVTATIGLDTPAAIVATGTITVNGAIVADAESIHLAGGTVSSGQGVGGNGVDSLAPYVGGGGGSFCGVGGAGGNATSANGAPGPTYGNATLIPLTLGGEGGGQSATTDSGGAGGGAIQLVAGTSITLAASSVLSAAGGGGWGSSSSGNGGGSGGALLLEAPTVTVQGTIAANGGGGGAGGSLLTGEGTSALIGTDGTHTTTGAAGGIGGETGGTGSGTSGTGGAGSGIAVDGGNGGASGGGGGAGFIRINTRSGTATTTGATFSPSTSSCSTQGTIAP
jgi:hypothetical protein